MTPIATVQGPVFRYYFLQRRLKARRPSAAAGSGPRAKRGSLGRSSKTALNLLSLPPPPRQQKQAATCCNQPWQSGPYDRPRDRDCRHPYLTFEVTR
jgi:hypothetical protein